MFCQNQGIPFLKGNEETSGVIECRYCLGIVQNGMCHQNLILGKKISTGTVI